jgi:diaminopimelate decarboxylase
MGEGKYKQLVFAGPDAKFGVIEKDAVEAYRKAKNYGFERFGIHMMAGFCVLDPKYFEAITERLMDIAGTISQQVGIDFEFINVGGGFGVPYAPDENDLDVAATAQKIVAKFVEKSEKYGMRPALFIEPGRYIVCDAGIILTRVNSIKNAYKKFVGVDAGMHTLLRPALYGAYHQMYVANKLNQAEREAVNVCGPICENTDILAKNRELPPIKEGDVLAILNAGAYGYAMSSQYNSRPRAAEVLVCGDAHDVIRERETFDDLTAKQHVPPRLAK